MGGLGMAQVISKKQHSEALLLLLLPLFGQVVKNFTPLF